LGLQTVDLVASCGLPFTAQPEAPASIKAGASGWAVNDETNSLLVSKVSDLRALQPV
jgi:hypothetical protein